MMRKVVFTVGAVLRGDDAAGPMLAKMMVDEPIAGWDVVDGGQMPEDDLGYIKQIKPDVLLLVDAADMGLKPGTVRVLDEDSVSSDFMLTTHSLPLSFLLKELSTCCGTVVFLGIQPAQIEFFGSLTPEVLDAVKAIYQHLADGASFADVKSVYDDVRSDDCAVD
ncbi:MAG: hydrogenase maturation peptidase HycI [Eggerthellaceae bacterium]|jgi:hydrogenase 3 maturation protease|nr:hydrogenase maturation peptidase HycI [Eggerthellaceae bacterium]MCH4221211.1 hydrogenase maturation peptidase HycI [Eggerthellaceae bacterium]